MPLKKAYSSSKPASAPADESPNLWQRMGGLRGLLATGARVGSGLIGSTASLTPGIGTAVGAGIGGLGEGVAEFIEDPTEVPSWKRMGVEAALTAVPLGKVFSGARKIAALRGGALAGAGVLGRSVAREEDVSPTELGAQTALGAGLGALLGGKSAPRMLSKEEWLAKKAAKNVRTEADIIEPTNRGGVGVGASGRPPLPIKPSGAGDISLQTPRTPSPVPNEAISQQMGQVAPSKAAQKLIDDEIAAEKIATMSEGLVRGEPRISESISTPIPGGTRRASVSMTRPEDEADEATDALSKLGEVLGVKKKAGAGRGAPNAARIQRPAQQKIAEGWTPSYGSTAPVAAPVPAAELNAAGAAARAHRLAQHEERVTGWRAAGKPENEAQQLSALGRTPPGMTVPEVVPFTPPTLGTAKPRGLAEALTPTPVVKEVAEATPVTATYLGEQEGVGPLYNLVGGDSDGSTVGLNTLKRMGVEVPPSIPPVRPAPLPAKAETFDEGVTRLAADRKANPENYAGPGLKETIESTDKTVKAAVDKIQPAKSPLAQMMEGRTTPETLTATGNQYPDEVTTELDRLGELYRGMSSFERAAEKTAHKAGGPVPVGAQMAELRDFFTPGKMRESWRGAAGEGGVATAPPVAPTPVAPVVPKTRKIVAEPTKSVPAVPGAADVTAVDPTDIGRRDSMTSELMQLLKGQSRGPAGGSETGAIAPELALQLGLGATGATIGAATDPFDNVFESTLAGGAVGLGSTRLPSLLKNIGIPDVAVRDITSLKSAEGVKEFTSKIFRTLPQFQRFNYLADAVGLPANAIVGPYGSAFMGALEYGLAGDPRGWQALKLLKNPMNFVREAKNSWEEAGQLIAHGEMGRAENVTGAMSDMNKVFTMPGRAMTSGDVAAKRFLERAGFSADEARRMTLTAEPELPAAKKVANLTKGSPLLQMLMPFARTPANIAEAGALRAPGLGFLLQGKREMPDPVRQQIVQQLMSAGVAGGAGIAGSQMDPETARIARRYITNAAGQYSLPASLGFAAGQAVNRGTDVFSPNTLRVAAEALPLPTSEPLMDWAKFVTSGGDPNSAPRGVMPPQVMKLLRPEPKGTLPKRLSRLREEFKGQ